jgi:hypothetical protein
MKVCHLALVGVSLALGFAALGFSGCAVLKPVPKSKLEVIPEEIVLSPDLITKPVQFRGSGFAPGEIVVVDMVLPRYTTVKGIQEGEDVGLAFDKADDRGNFEATMGPTATLNWFFQVGWTPFFKPDFKQAQPLPPGKYEIRATGMDSETVVRAVMEILPPPEKGS